MKAKTSNNRRQTKAAAPAADEGRLFLDKFQVAKRLGVHPRTVGTWAQQEKLPAYRFGWSLRFKWEEVEQAMAATFRYVPVAAPLANKAVAARHALPTKGGA